MAQVVAADVGILLEGLALHPFTYVIGDRLDSEALVDAAISSYCLGSHRPTSLPLVECCSVGQRIVAVDTCRNHTCAANEDGGHHPLNHSFHYQIVLSYYYR